MDDEPVRLLGDAALERSAVVANRAMNRERRLAGYGRELGIDVLGEIRERLARRDRVCWVDLCCGEGRALTEVALRLADEGLDARADLVGVDLVGHFAPAPPAVRLVTASVTAWEPGRPVDLVTCVHGLHYVGDKLGALARIASWLAPDGLAVASFDPGSVRLAGGAPAGRRLTAALRAAGLEYVSRRRRVVCRGRRDLDPPYRYLGADDRAGPNYTGQPAVDSYYEPRR
ncbi:class I SAM-dependent methyltransferase [Actinomadura craniellae]|nr:class I SAM-dependent methyltransferase [Actinomadura craniellae]